MLFGEQQPQAAGHVDPGELREGFANFSVGHDGYDSAVGGCHDRVHGRSAAVQLRTSHEDSLERRLGVLGMELRQTHVSESRVHCDLWHVTRGIHPHSSAHAPLSQYERDRIDRHDAVVELQMERHLFERHLLRLYARGAVAHVRVHSPHSLRIEFRIREQQLGTGAVLVGRRGRGLGGATGPGARNAATEGRPDIAEIQ